MTLVPVRDIGKLGVNTDVDPFDLSLASFTMGTNCRFVDNRIQRGPLFSTVGALTNTSPRYSFSYKLQNGTSKFIVANENGTATDWGATAPGNPSTETNVSPTAYTPSTQTLPFTATVLNNVVYLNRSDRVPWSWIPADTKFTNLPVWDSTWRCQALRSFNSALIAINVTKGAIQYPTMVKTSDFTLFGSTPGAWAANPTNSASENVLADLQDPLVDGWPLRDRFILYANTETWLMSSTGDFNIFSYNRLFSNRGVLNVNCVVENHNSHYVFGYDDIWVHDGYTPKSLAAGRVKNFVFNNLVRDQAYQSFVLNNPRRNEVMFCYVSMDPFCAFPVNSTIGYPGCNRAAVYNWQYDTWAFYDLPYLVGGGIGLAYSGLTYNDLSTAALTYDSISGTYNGYFDATRLNFFTVGRAATVDATMPQQVTGSIPCAVRVFELESQSQGIGTLCTIENAPVFLENVQMDMDDLAKELRGYKVVNSIYPEARFPANAPPMYVSWGSCDYSNQIPVYGADMTFDGDTLYKLDFNSPGRYLSVRMVYPGNQDFSWSAMDIDFQLFSHR